MKTDHEDASGKINSKKKSKTVRKYIEKSLNTPIPTIKWGQFTIPKYPNPHLNKVHVLLLLCEDQHRRGCFLEGVQDVRHTGLLMVGGKPDKYY